MGGHAQPPCYRLQPTASHILRLRFVIKFIFSSKIGIIDGPEGLYQSHALLSTSFPFFFLHFFHLYLMNEQILDVMCGWTTLLYASK
jgi:hypothetical protein